MHWLGQRETFNNNNKNVIIMNEMKREKQNIGTQNIMATMHQIGAANSNVFMTVFAFHCSHTIHTQCIVIKWNENKRTTCEFGE